MQGVFGSLSVRTSCDSLRRAGAAAREMLVAGGGAEVECRSSAVPRREQQRWSIPATNARLTYGSLAEAAAKLAAPANPHAQGSRAVPGSSASRSSAWTRPRRWTAARSSASTSACRGCCTPWWRAAPCSAARSKSFDAAKAKAVPGVKNVVQISNGVAVIADNTWSAMQGRKRAGRAVGRGSRGRQ